MTDYSKFKKSLEHLKDQWKNHQTLDPSQSKLIKEAVAESVIQRFETCYDCLWKILKRYLSESCGVPEMPNSPKPIFRIAFENHVLSSPVETWIIYANLRIGTSHDYNGEKAQEALRSMEDFVRDATLLYQTMTREV